MKKILLSVFLVVTIGFINSSRAQCNGANVAINSFTITPLSTVVFYRFDWTYVRGNASIEVAILCNGTQIGSRPCLPWLKDSTAGPHIVNGSFPFTCSGVVRVEVRIWSNNSCGGTYCVADFRDFAPIPLPVSFKSFSAARNHSNVLLKWETITERNSEGFAIDRNVGGTWEQIAFVTSKGQNGNSDALLGYSYIDQNQFKGVSQYRIRQVDFDSKSRYSEIRSVRGEGQTGKTIIYPNPTNDGNVNVVFEETNVTRNVSVIDMSGRVIKQWRSVTNNNLTIDNLTPGMYSLRIVTSETGEQTIEKIVVNKK